MTRIPSLISIIPSSNSTSAGGGLSSPLDNGRVYIPSSQRAKLRSLLSGDDLPDLYDDVV